MVVDIVLGQVKFRSVHLADRLDRDLLGLEELVEPTVLVLFNGGECVDSVTSCVDLNVEGPVGAARPVSTKRSQKW